MTPALLGSLTTVAVSPVLFVPTTVGLGGATIIPTDGTRSVAEADFVLSVTDVPVTVTVKSLPGGVAGAVYVIAVPLAVSIVPQAGEHAEPFCCRVQFTMPPVGSLFTVPLIINAAPT